MPSPNRASGVWGWTAPLRTQRDRHRRLAASSFVCASLALATAVYLVVSRAPSLALLHLLLVIALAAVALVLFVLGVMSRRASARLEEEMAELEAEAVRHLETR